MSVGREWAKRIALPSLYCIGRKFALRNCARLLLARSGKTVANTKGQLAGVKRPEWESTSGHRGKLIFVEGSQTIAFDPELPLTVRNLTPRAPSSAPVRQS
jgi:hypothetical protein